MSRNLAVSRFRSLPGVAAALAMAATVQSSSGANLDIVDITWSLGPNMPAVRKAGAAAFVNGQVVYAGGSESATNFETNTTFAWTPGAPSWTNLTNMPINNGYLDGIGVNGSLYQVAGRFGGMGGSTQSAIRKLSFNGTSYVWQTLPNLLPRTRGFHTVGVVGDTIYAVGGGRFNQGNPVNMWDRQVKDADFVNITTGVTGQIPDLPGVERFGPTTAGVNGKLYVFGGTNLGEPGVDPYDSDRLNDAYVFNPATNSWSGLPSLPFGYSNGYATVWSDRYIIMVGGVAEITENDPYPPTEPNYYNNMVIVYDTRKGNYTILPTVMPKGTGDIRAVLVGTTLYAMGGETKGQETPTPLFNSNWLRVGELQLGPGEWDVDADASWNAGLSWSTTIPNGVGAQVNFLETITAPRTVMLDSPVTGGFISFTNTNRYTIAGTSTLTLQVASGDGFVALLQGNHSILAPINVVSPMKFLGPGALTTGNIASNTTLTIQTATTSGNIDGAGTLIVSPARALSAARVRQNAVIVNGTLNLSGAGTDANASRVATLSMAGGATPTARVNIGDSALVIDYTGVSPLNTVRSQILAGRAGGAWTGNGISSSAAAASGGTTGVGYAEASVIGRTMLGDLSLDGTAIIVRHTLLGDANLDRIVDIGDFSLLAANFNAAGPWSSGDFDYDGTVTIGDFAQLAANFNQQLAARSSLVPEPAFAAAYAGIIGLCLRRRANRFEKSFYK